MESLFKQAEKLLESINLAMDQLRIGQKNIKISKLQEESNDPNFWKDSKKAQALTKELAQLKEQVGNWKKLSKEARELLDIASLKDESLQKDLEVQLTEVEKRFDSAKKELMFTGEYDSNEVILGLYSGAGGTDAQDWAEMLLRMYLRWAQTEGLKVEVLEQTSGDEAGIKSAVVEIIGGQFLYGKLKGEHGIHRLVRLSPFNSDNLRQTSFAKVDVLPKIDKPEDINIDEKDLKIDVYRSGGHGGQSVNTTDSAVRITHIPTGISVAIQNERSQLQNKETAMTILRSRLIKLRLDQHKDSLEEIKGPNQSAEWGNQIRSYVLHPYKQVKDLRTKAESSDPAKVLGGGINMFIEAYLEMNTLKG